MSGATAIGGNRGLLDPEDGITCVADIAGLGDIGSPRLCNKDQSALIENVASPRNTGPCRTVPEQRHALRQRRSESKRVENEQRDDITGSRRLTYAHMTSPLCYEG